MIRFALFFLLRLLLSHLLLKEAAHFLHFVWTLKQSSGTGLVLRLLDTFLLLQIRLLSICNLSYHDRHRNIIVIFSLPSSCLLNLSLSSDFFRLSFSLCFLLRFHLLLDQALAFLLRKFLRINSYLWLVLVVIIIFGLFHDNNFFFLWLARIGLNLNLFLAEALF